MVVAILHNSILIAMEIVYDVDNDGICDQLEDAGCTDVSACNFNPFVTEEDGSCENTSCYGC